MCWLLSSRCAPASRTRRPRNPRFAPEALERRLSPSLVGTPAPAVEVAPPDPPPIAETPTEPEPEPQPEPEPEPEDPSLPPVDDPEPPVEPGFPG